MSDTLQRVFKMLGREKVVDKSVARRLITIAIDMEKERCAKIASNCLQHTEVNGREYNIGYDASCIQIAKKIRGEE